MVCGSCGNTLTNALSQLDEMPSPTHAQPGDERYLPTIPIGAWATDPDPIGWRQGLPTSTLGCPVINPADAIGVLPSEDPLRNSGCCGHDGLDGPNLLCRGCRSEVATLRNDCWTVLEVRFEPAAVVIRPSTRDQIIHTRRGRCARSVVIRPGSPAPGTSGSAGIRQQVLRSRRTARGARTSHRGGRALPPPGRSRARGPRWRTGLRPQPGGGAGEDHRRRTCRWPLR